MDSISASQNVFELDSPIPSPDPELESAVDLTKLHDIEEPAPSKPQLPQKRKGSKLTAKPLETLMTTNDEAFLDKIKQSHSVKLHGLESSIRIRHEGQYYETKLPSHHGILYFDISVYKFEDIADCALDELWKANHRRLKYV